MPKLLYLDTARLGQMSPGARRASFDFSRFAGEFGCSLYLSDFLKDGFEAWPGELREQFSSLSDWQGVAALKNRLRTLGQARPESNCVVAARSASLMTIAARLMFGLCRNVLTTDLSWKPYQRILQRHWKRSTGRATQMQLRRALFGCRASAEETVDLIARKFAQRRCDGLFLPLVDCFGVRLPIVEIVERIRSENELRFVVVDGAQAINHVPLRLNADYCDFLLAGCHKWLHSFTPMGVGFYGRARSKSYIRESIRRWQRKGEITDPLMSFAEELETGRNKRFGESVAVSSMITANAAVCDAVEGPKVNDEAITHNRELIESTATSDGRWRLLTPGKATSHRIMMLQSRTESRTAFSDRLRGQFHLRGIAVSTYRGGRVRISLPATPLQSEHELQLKSAFESI